MCLRRKTTNINIREVRILVLISAAYWHAVLGMLRTISESEIITSTFAVCFLKLKDNQCRMPIAYYFLAFIRSGAAVI